MYDVASCRLQRVKLLRRENRMQEKDSEKLLNKIWWQIYAGVYVLSLHKFGILHWPYGAGYRLGLSLSCFPFVFWCFNVS